MLPTKLIQPLESKRKLSMMMKMKKVRKKEVLAARKRKSLKKRRKTKKTNQKLVKLQSSPFLASRTPTSSWDVKSLLLTLVMLTKNSSPLVMETMTSVALMKAPSDPVYYVSGPSRTQSTLNLPSSRSTVSHVVPLPNVTRTGSLLETLTVTLQSTTSRIASIISIQTPLLTVKTWSSSILTSFGKSNGSIKKEKMKL